MLFGGALATAMWLTLGAVQQTPPATLRVVQDPHPDFVIRVMEGTPYTVPAGSMLSVKTLGVSNDASFAGGLSVMLRINGTNVFMGRADPNPTQLDTPVVAGPGDVVTVEDQFGDPGALTVALGYLTRT
jgi:hypothetical protein